MSETINFFSDLFKVEDDNAGKPLKIASDHAGVTDVAGATDTLTKSRFNIPDFAPKAPLQKRDLTAGAPMDLFMQLSKVDEEQRLVYGIATSEVPDRQNEILDYEASKPYFQQWSDSVHKDSGGVSRGNVREMHQNIACGTLAQIAFDDRKKEISVCAKITDDNAWKKVLSRTYTGFSVGGKYVSTMPDVGGLTRFVASPSEISLVDRPACPTSTFQLVKKDGSVEICKFTHRNGENMTPEEKMADLHRRHSNHFTETAQSHKNMASRHEALAAHFKKSEDGEAEKHHAALAEDHHGHAEKDSVLAAWHHNSMEECDKAVRAQMNKVAADVAPSALEDAVRSTFLKMFGNVVMPTQVSSIAPPAPARPAFIPRAGQPPASTAAPVPLEFQKLFSVEDGGEPLRQANP